MQADGGYQEAGKRERRDDQERRRERQEQHDLPPPELGARLRRVHEVQEYWPSNLPGPVHGTPCVHPELESNIIGGWSEKYAVNPGNQSSRNI